MGPTAEAALAPGLRSTGTPGHTFGGVVLESFRGSARAAGGPSARLVLPLGGEFDVDPEAYALPGTPG